MVKKIIFILYILVLVCMAAATIVEKSQGTNYAHAHYYGAWWFILIWAVLAALGAFYIIKRKVKCPTHACISKKRHDSSAHRSAYRYLYGSG